MDPRQPCVHRDEAGANDPFVQFEDVQKSYDGKTFIIKNLDLQVHRGEFLTLLGPSGSGKTTSLMLLAGFEVPSGGRILVDGKSIKNIPPHRRNIGVVFQNYALFPHLTVAENITFPLAMRKCAREVTRARLRETLDLVRLRGMEHRKPHQLSGGQQQRVALARALIFDPAMILMDEPLGALDKTLREQLQVEIKRIHNAVGKTIVYVTHDQTEALTLSDRIAVFDRGKVQQDGSPAEIYEKPATAFVAGFVGDCNLISAEVVTVCKDQVGVRLADGSPFVATPGSSFAVGDRTTLAVRPERIVQVSSPNVQNSFRAKVTEVIYCGDFVKASLLGPSDLALWMKIPIGQAQDLRTGGTLQIGWNVSHCRALSAQ